MTNLLPCGIAVNSTAVTKGASSPPQLNSTQAVVVALITRLLPEQRHVYIDNSFSSPELFKALRQLGIGVTGIACTSRGLYRRLIDLKDDDRKGQRMWPWGRFEAFPTVENKVNQIAWKDNALLLFLSTVYKDQEIIVGKKRRPKAIQPYSRPIRTFFGDKAVKKVSILATAADYNSYMKAVDRADNLRANMKI